MTHILFISTAIFMLRCGFLGVIARLPGMVSDGNGGSGVELRVQGESLRCVFLCHVCMIISSGKHISSSEITNSLLVFPSVRHQQPKLIKMRSHVTSVQAKEMLSQLIFLKGKLSSQARHLKTCAAFDYLVICLILQFSVDNRLQLTFLQVYTTLSCCIDVHGLGLDRRTIRVELELLEDMSVYVERGLLFRVGMVVTEINELHYRVVLSLFDLI